MRRHRAAGAPAHHRLAMRAANGHGACAREVANQSRWMRSALTHVAVDSHCQLGSIASRTVAPHPSRSPYSREMRREEASRSSNGWLATLVRPERDARPTLQQTAPRQRQRKLAPTRHGRASSLGVFGLCERLRRGGYPHGHTCARAVNTPGQSKPQTCHRLSRSPRTSAPHHNPKPPPAAVRVRMNRNPNRNPNPHASLHSMRSASSSASEGSSSSSRVTRSQSACATEAAPHV